MRCWRPPRAAWGCQPFEETDEPLDHWTISQRLEEIHPGDDWALWVAGRHAGVYALGTVASEPHLSDADDEYWVRPPAGAVHGVDLTTTHYLFDQPITKARLQADPDFADALILRMPRTANPIPLSDTEWAALRQHVGPQDRPQRPTATGPIVTTRGLGEVQEDVDVAGPQGGRRRTFSESRLVKDYERFLDRELVVRTVRLPSGERLVFDAYDQQQDLLLEAKSSASRQDERMAIGQLFDYRRHLAPTAQLAVLLPEPPNDDALDLLRQLNIQVVVRTAGGFNSLP